MIKLKKTTKYLVFIAIALSLVLTLFACKDNTEEQEPNYATDLYIHNDTVYKFGKDEHLVINSEYNGVKIRKLDVQSYRTNISSYPAKTLTLPKTLQEITTKSLDALTNLEAYYVEPGNVYFKAIDGVLYNDTGTVLISYPAEKKGETFVIPEGVRIISYRAFSSNTYLKEIIIPDTVTHIEERAFAYLDSLKKIVIPDSVTILGESAFQDCIFLEDITIGQAVRTIEDKAFYHCKNLESIVIPDSVKNLGVELFSRCTSLKEITLPSDLTHIPNSMFSGCTALTSYTVPDSILRIGNSSFSGSGLTEITFPEGLLSISDSFQNCTGLTSVTCPASLEAMGSAFRGCTNLESITFLGGGTRFSTNCFVDCKNLKEVHASSVEDWTSMSFSHAESSPFLYGAKLYIGGEFVTDFEFPSGTTSLSSYLFAGYTYLESVIIPEGVESIDGGTFQGCYKISEITIPSTVTNISVSSFSSCDSLKDVYIPSLEWWLNVKMHYPDLFENAERVYVDGVLTTEIYIPEGTERIESFTFYQCSFLTAIHIPVSVRYLSTNSIALCGELAIYYNASTKEFEFLDDKSHYWYDSRDNYVVYTNDGEIEI